MYVDVEAELDATQVDAGVNRTGAVMTRSPQDAVHFRASLAMRSIRSAF